ncbi:hypothetical protein DNTS_017019 [Danionella cerebrum]|uniref:palmitoyl-protein hydrolase n=1 Tax=Danionella cerebrum TaxID=2873325 RepID=A0A553MKN1_9TELE|nr:hypothetical protein DNTS_017019 [Danionella translucida]
MAALKLQKRVVSQTGKHTASVIFLHGSGDTGLGLRHWVSDILGQNLAFEHIRVIYPTAPPRPYTPMRGAQSNVWFDRLKISPDCPEHLESINSMCDQLSDIIQEEVRAGIPKKRMVIGGFSMGGAMALHLVYRHHQDIAGTFALSSFLNKDSVVYKADTPGTPITLTGGEECHSSLWFGAEIQSGSIQFLQKEVVGVEDKSRHSTDILEGRCLQSGAINPSKMTPGETVMFRNRGRSAGKTFSRPPPRSPPVPALRNKLRSTDNNHPNLHTNTKVGQICAEEKEKMTTALSQLRGELQGRQRRLQREMVRSYNIRAGRPVASHGSLPLTDAALEAFDDSAAGMDEANEAGSTASAPHGVTSGEQLKRTVTCEPKDTLSSTPSLQKKMHHPQSTTSRLHATR